MFGFYLENGSLKLLCREQLIFDKLTSSLFTDDLQNHEYLTFNRFIQDEKYEVFIAEGENSSIRINAFYGDSTVAVRVNASLKQNEPLFRSIQPYFAANQAVRLELSMKEQEKFVALYQHKPWWIRPKFFSRIADIPQRSQLIMWKKDKFYFVMLAICGRQYRTDFCTGKYGIAAVLSSNCDYLRVCDDVSFVMSSGIDPYDCCEQAVRTALALLDGFNCHRKEKLYPTVFEYLGWCSWDAFYHDINEEGIFNKLEEMQQKNVPLKWVLIDDGWLEADYKTQRLIGMDAAKDKFCKGLKETVRVIKEKYGIRYVGLWQAIMGYWNGINPNSEADCLLKENIEVLPNGAHVPKASESGSFGFWNRWHSYLRKCSIDFVKVDSQSAISIFYRGLKSYGEASYGMHRGLEASVSLHFDKQIINCMGMAPQDMWNRASSSISRSSDDFVPGEKHSFREHAIQNAYNSLLHGQLYWGDWDMFWSEHDDNWQNSVLRSISGGPVYVSDPVGKSNPTYILPLVLRDGRVLRCEDVGMPTADCLFEDPIDSIIPLKIFNRYKNCHVIAAFNINAKEKICGGMLSIEDIPSMARQAYYVYQWKARTVNLLRPGEQILFDLLPNDAELFLLIPHETCVTPIGLADKFISPAAIDDVRWQGDSCFVCLKQGGMFAFVAERAPRHVKLNGERIEAVMKDGVYYVECNEEDRPIVCITV